MNNPLRSAPDSRLQRIAGPCGIVLFGITGDLAQRKILPALYDLANRGLLPPSFAIVGVARRHIENIEEVVEASIRRGAKTAVTSTTLSQLLSGLHLVEGQFDDDATYQLELAFKALDRAETTPPWLVDRAFRDVLIDELIAPLQPAADLGARPWQRFWLVTVPLSREGILAGSLLVFIPAVGEYVIPELLGGPETLMIGRVLWDEFFSNNDWPMASTVAVVMILVIIVPLAIFGRNQVQAQEQEG